MGLSREVVKALIATVELCGAAALSDVAQALMEADLEQYPETSVLMALARCRKELRGRLTLADIIERIDDGRPGAEEAWSAVSGATEATTLVLTEEMQQALAVAWPQMAAGDLVPARMAFLETYRKVALTARAAGAPLKWRVSLGQDPAGRLAPIRDAVAKGRLTAAEARLQLPAHEAATIGLPEADARRMLGDGQCRAEATVTRLLADPTAGKATAVSGLTADEQRELDALKNRHGVPWSRRDMKRVAELEARAAASARPAPGVEHLRGLDGLLKPKRQPSQPIDWQEAEARLQRQHEGRQGR